MTYKEKIPLPYHFIRWLFSTCLKIFYNTIEVQGTVPPPGNCVLLCPNHGNSLTDAVTVVSQTPRMVRLTAKDTLWKLPFWRVLIEGVGTVPLQRRDEHGSAADNTNAKAKLFDALESGSCVCLFPEGLSRYQSGIAPLKPGVGSIAIEMLKRAAAKGMDDFKISIVTCGITYTHREKFRSDICVIFETAMVLRPENLPDLIGGESGARGGAQRIIEEVGRSLRNCVVSGSDWSTVKGASIAARIYAPFGTQIDLSQHVRLTQSFVKILSTSTSTTIEERRLKRTPSDPDIPVQDLISAPEKEAYTGALLAQLLSYQEGLEAAGLSDSALQDESKGIFFEIVGGTLRGLWCILLGTLTIPGLVVLAPAFLGGKLLEWKLIGENTGERRVRNLDEIAQYKLAVCGILGPPLVLIGAGYFKHFLFPNVPILVLLLVTALWLWLTVRWIEDGVSSANALVKHVHLLLQPEVANVLREKRKALVPLVESLAVEYGLPSPRTLLKEASPSCAKRSSILSYFSLRGRRRKEWGECAHYGQTPIDYPIYVHQKQQSMKRKDQ